ncbi:SCY1-like protein 2 isoform X2 [Amphiura filiformis]
MPSPVPAEIREHKLYEVEIKYGLLQVTDALKFLHNDVHLIHGNISPESIILNSNGAWKLTGFDFCIASSTPPDQPASFPMREWNEELPPAAQPRLDYMAPEYILTMSCDTASDMFSLGMMMYAVMNRGKVLYECNDNLRTYKKNCEQLRCLSMNILNSLPDGMKEYVKMLLSSTPTVRPDADQLSKIPFFDDVGSMTLQYLDSLFQRDNINKSQFFKGLPKALKTMPKRVIHQRVLPSLSKELMNPDMIPFVLPNILTIAEECTEQEYVNLILPDLKPVFKVQEPVQILLIFMQKMDLLLTKTPKDDVKNHVLPMVYRALEAPSPQIQEMCLTILPTFAGMIDYAAMKHSIVPRIKKLCLETDRLAVRVGCLVCTGKMMSYMDKWFIIDEVIPMLMDIPSKEPAVLMGILGIIKTAMTHKKLGLTKDVMATKLLPYLCPLCIENGLNLPQFNAFMSVVKEMLRQVETDHRGKLEQITSMQQEQRSAVDFNQTANGGSQLSSEDPFALMGSGTGSKANSNKQGDSAIESMFKSFGLGNYLGSGSEKIEAINKSSSPAPQKPTSNSNPATKIPAQNEVSLSLAEKQKLQKEQEFQERLKKQQPIHASQANPKSNSTGGASSKPTDLTNTLLNSTPPSDLSGMSAGVSSKSALSSSSTLGMSYSAPSPVMNNQAMYGGSTMGYGVGGPTSKPQPGNQSTTKSNSDTSAFDTLLGPQFGSKSKPSLSQMSQGGQRSAMGQTSSMGQPGMMGMQQGMMGMNQAPMGMNQTPMGMQQQSTMGMYSSSMGMGGMMGNPGSMMGTQGMVGNWQTQGVSQMGGGRGGGGSGSQMSGDFDPLAPIQQNKPQVKSDSLLDF